jgi:hypothetical protein
MILQTEYPNKRQALLQPVSTSTIAVIGVGFAILLRIYHIDTSKYTYYMGGTDSKILIDVNYTEESGGFHSHGGPLDGL